FTLRYMYCDERSISLAVPNDGYIKRSGRVILYMYYILESRNGAFLNFMTDSTLNFKSKGHEGIFILFKNNNEHQEFENYLENNLDKLDEIDDSGIGSIIQDRITKAGEYFNFNPVEMSKLKKLFEIWKIHKDIT
ncbi:MAG: hypothetical protein ACRC2V_05970, partial [Xenococcaceae cyanobacterium]